MLRRTLVLALGLSYFIWLAAHGYAMLVLFALAMGASYGGYVALNPSVVAELFGVSGMGVVLGTLYTSIAITALFPFKNSHSTARDVGHIRLRALREKSSKKLFVVYVRLQINSAVTICDYL